MPGGKRRRGGDERGADDAPRAEDIAKRIIEQYESIQDASVRRRVREIVHETWACEEPDGIGPEDDAGDAVLDAVRSFLKPKLPVNAHTKTEKIVFPKSGQFQGYEPHNTVNVDGFLYTEDDIDDLCEAGKMSRYYCDDPRCEYSQNVKLLSAFRIVDIPGDFVSQSFSKDELRALFQGILPDLTGKCVLDVGSRLGAALYGAHVFSRAAKICGVERDTTFAQLSLDTLKRFRMNDRCSVIAADIFTCKDLVAEADVVILHNVFEFFYDENERVKVWSLARELFSKPGQMLVLSPPFHEQTQGISLTFDWSEWVERVDIDVDDLEDQGFDREEAHLEDFELLRVLPREEH